MESNITCLWFNNKAADDVRWWLTSAPPHVKPCTTWPQILAADVMHGGVPGLAAEMLANASRCIPRDILASIHVLQRAGIRHHPGAVESCHT